MDYAYLPQLYGFYGGGPNDYYFDDYDLDQYGGSDYTEAECHQWLSDNFVNPRTGRKIGPTKSGRGVYYDLQNSCMQYASTAYSVQTPKPIQAQPLKLTTQGSTIVRQTTGKSGSKRKAPAESATSFPVGTKKIGGDGQMYIIKLRSNNTQYWQPCAQKTAKC